MKPLHYVLNPDHTTRPVSDVLVWAKHFEEDERYVARDELPNDVSVSTVFLGLEHNYTDEGPPLLFETMIFGGRWDDYCVRYSTWDEAVKGHQRAVDLANGKYHSASNTGEPSYRVQDDDKWEG